jgi:bifunctional DNA primase/polymerase-like protein/primase-like protein
VGLFREIAEPLVARNVPVIPLRPKTKIAFLNNWQDAATTDFKKIQEWDEEYPDANAACVAFPKPDAVWFFEIDKPDFLDTIEKQTGQKMPATFAVRSSPGRGHLYFKQTPASLAMGNLQGKDDEGRESWSARVSNRYVVAPGSFHPTSGERYKTLRDLPIAPAPDWLVEWCLSNQKTEEKTGHLELDDTTLIPSGSRNSSLASILGKARQVLSMDREQLFLFGVSVNQKRCNPPLSESEVRTIANSIGRYAVTTAAPVIMGGAPLGQPQAQIIEAVEPEKIKVMPYPIFPRWVMRGTSLYEGMIAPICEKNSRFPEFMFMPGAVMILNYLFGKVRIEYKNTIPSFYLINIGRKGRVIKSSSVKDAAEYLHAAGIIEDAGPQTRNAGGKSLIFTVGSAEGLGMEMTRTNCKNVVLFYDELSTLTSKAGIEGSSLISNMNTMYESGKFANTTKARKEIYNFEPNSYCASVIACTTDKNFLQNWSKMAGGSSGLDERFFFLYQPENLPEPTPQVVVQTKDAAVETRKRLDKAIAQGVYHITDSTPLEQKIGKLGNRTEIRAEKLALYFAVDLGRDEIDEDCVARGIAICEYELAAKKYLSTFESTSKESIIQNEIIQALQRNAGRMEKRNLEKIVHPIKHGTSMYYKCFAGLVSSGYLAIQGTGVKNDPEIVILMRNVERDEE